MHSTTSKLSEASAVFSFAASARTGEDASGGDRPRRRDQSKAPRIEIVAADDDCDEPWADNRLW